MPGEFSPQSTLSPQESSFTASNPKREIRLDSLTFTPREEHSLREVRELDSLSASELNKLEEFLGSEKQNYSYQGRNRFALLPYERAKKLRIERVIDEQELTLERKATPTLSEDTVVFTQNSGSPLAKRVFSRLGITPAKRVLESFANSETRIEVHESVRDKHAIILADINNPVNEGIIEVALLINALRLADPRKISVIFPTFPYARQDRRADTRPPISAKAMTSIFKTMGADRLITIDIHARQAEGFFDGPFENLEGLPHMIPAVIQEIGSDFIAVSPDAGGGKRAEHFARIAEEITGGFIPVITGSKVRKEPGVPPEITFSVGSEFLKGKTCVLTDDMIDTGGSILVAARRLKEHGAAKVIVVATHPVCSKDAVVKLKEANFSRGGQVEPVIDRIYVSDTLAINHPRDEQLRVVSLSPLLAEVIKRLDEKYRSLGALNKTWNFGEELPNRFKSELIGDGAGVYVQSSMTE